MINSCSRLLYCPQFRITFSTLKLLIRFIASPAWSKSACVRIKKFSFFIPNDFRYGIVFVFTSDWLLFLIPPVSISIVLFIFSNIESPCLTSRYDISLGFIINLIFVCIVINRIKGIIDFIFLFFSPIINIKIVI